MRAVFPGKPQAKLQAVSTALWEGRRIITYISCNALVVLGGPNDLLQTIYHTEEELRAVAIDKSSGKIATCTNKYLYIYNTFGHDEGALKWSLQYTLEPSNGSRSFGSLSWGLPGEILLGGSSLTLFSTSSKPKELWTRKLANAVKLATFSHDASFIASTGAHDRLVKVWRRLFFGEGNERFDVTYLPHPATVTELRWRQCSSHDQQSESVLYTICSDNKLRIWAAIDLHSLQALQLWAELDLADSIQLREAFSSPLRRKRYVFIIDSWDFKMAIESAAQHKEGAEREHLNRKHLVERTAGNPEVCVIFDELGNMSAWGLERVGCKARHSKNVFNLAYVEGFNLHFLPLVSPEEDYLQVCSFAGNGRLHMLVNYFDGRIQWLSCAADRFLDPSGMGDRLNVEGTWTGHREPIENLSRTIGGTAFISKSFTNEAIVWLQGGSDTNSSLRRQSVCQQSEEVLAMRLIHGGDHILFLLRDRLALWNTSSLKAAEIASCPYTIEGAILCLVLLQASGRAGEPTFVASMTSEMRGTVWTVSTAIEPLNVSLKLFATFQLDNNYLQTMIIPLDSARREQTASDFSPGATDVALSYDGIGTLSTWNASVDTEKRKVQWKRTNVVLTGVANASVVGISSTRKAAFVESTRTRLTIWDSRDSELEHEVDFEKHESVRSLHWTSTDARSSILAVGLTHKVLIYSQLRYDYLDARTSWATIRVINITNVTNLSIADVLWLKGGDLIVAAGHEIFLYDTKIEVSDSIASELPFPVSSGQLLDMLNIADALNATLPVYHPQILAQCLAIGKLTIVQHVLTRLYKRLKFYTDGDGIAASLGFVAEDFSDQPLLSPTDLLCQDEDNVAEFPESAAAALKEKLLQLQLPHVSEKEKMHLIDIAECFGSLEKHRRSVDDLGIRYLAFLHWGVLRASRADGEILQLPWREITWASLSNSHDILVDRTSRLFQGRMLWKHARESGMFMWMSDIIALRAQFEVIARNEYTKSYEKNPVDCALYYLALKKKSVLAGLWRIATWHREQSATLRLLANNFDDPRWKTAALKNAYALLGRRRAEYAAAFFLLAGQLKDAVGVLSSQVGDLQLAITVARVYEGDNGPVLRQLLETIVLPRAVREGNRWLATWAFRKLGRKDMALRVLLVPPGVFFEGVELSEHQAKHYLTADPALADWYRQLRTESSQSRHYTLEVPALAEWDLVMHSARLYNRMGCQILALDLVRNWEFSTPLPSAQQASAESGEGPTEKRPELEAISSEKPEEKLVTNSIARKKVIEEPSTNSILDSFDF